MKARFLAILAILVLIVGLVPTVSAQDGGCFNLPAEDCELLLSAVENTGSVTSFQYNLSMDFSATGLAVLAMMTGEQVPEPVTFNMAGSGAFGFTPENQLPITLSADLDANAATGEETLFSGPIVVAVTNDYVYFPMEMQPGAEIIGVPITEEMIEEFDLSSLAAELGAPVSPDMLEGGQPTNLGELLGPALGGGDTEDMLAETGFDFNQYFDFQRLPDEELMDQTMYPFAFSVDVTGILNSPEFAEAMAMFTEMPPEQDPTGGMLQMLPMLLSGVESNITFTRWVGADDNFIHRLNLDMDFSMDLAPLMGGAGGEDQPEMEPIVLDFALDFQLSDINEPVEVTAPEGARELTEEEAAEMFESEGF